MIRLQHHQIWVVKTCRDGPCPLLRPSPASVPESSSRWKQRTTQGQGLTMTSWTCSPWEYRAGSANHFVYNQLGSNCDSGWSSELKRIHFRSSQHFERLIPVHRPYHFCWFIHVLPFLAKSSGRGFECSNHNFRIIRNDTTYSIGAQNNPLMSSKQQ